MRTYSLTSDDLRVLAFARGWSPNTEGQTRLEMIRLRVMEVGVELIVLGERGVWIFGVDGCLDFVDRLAGDLALSATMMQTNRDNAVYLIDDGKVVRVAYDGSLVDAMTGVSELLAMKRAFVEAPQDTTMPNGLFAPVFETSYANDTYDAKVVS
jgi:hypothetical protein